MSITGAGLMAMKRLATNGTLGAIGEIVDNSLQHSDNDVNIEVAFVQSNERVEHIIISDDGYGIGEADGQLIIDKCLWFGAGDNFGATQGIGKFGIGLPFACCSQSSYYEVISWTSKGDLKRIYRKHSEWGMNDLIKDLPHETVTISDLSEMVKIVCKKTLNNTSGTIVVWNDCDNLDFKKGKTLVNHLERDLSRLYRYYIDNGAQISLNIYNRAENDGFSRLMLDAENSRDIEYFDPLFLRESPLTSPHYSGPCSDSWFEPNVTRDYSYTDMDKTVHTFQITASLAKEGVQKPEGNKSRGGKAPLGVIYERNMFISLVRADRELKMGNFGFFKNNSEPRARWWKVEVKFQPISDEILGVNSNKTDASHFKFIDKRFFDEENDSNALMYELGGIISECIRDMMVEIKERGKPTIDGVKCVQVACKGLVINGTCNKCEVVYENCPKCKTVLTSDGTCNSCAWITPKVCPIHKIEYAREGHCPTCGPVVHELSKEDKDDIKSALRSYVKYAEATDQELESLFDWFIASGKRHFLIFAENSVDDTQMFFPKRMPKKSFNLVIVNTRHNFYKMVISKVIDSLNSGDGNKDMQIALDAIIMMFISWSKLEIDLSNQGDGNSDTYLAVTDLRSDIGREMQRILNRY